VHVSALGPDDERRRSVAALGRAAGWLRGQLGRRLHIKRMPALTFVLDTSYDYGARIQEVLDGVRPVADDHTSGED
jgi:ribosome-binding factor A